MTDGPDVLKLGSGEQTVRHDITQSMCAVELQYLTVHRSQLARSFEQLKADAIVLLIKPER